MIPSIKTIQAAFPRIDRAKAVAIRGLMDGSVSPDDYPSVREWVAKCFTPPRAHERALLALNEVLDACGTESLSLGTAPWDRYYCDIVADYVNMGDTYVATITRDRAGVWRVESWGDALERAERKYGAAEGEES
jgi:hypothetical protein